MLLRGRICEPAAQGCGSSSNNLVLTHDVHLMLILRLLKLLLLGLALVKVQDVLLAAMVKLMIAELVRLLRRESANSNQFTEIITPQSSLARDSIGRNQSSLVVRICRERVKQNPTETANDFGILIKVWVQRVNEKL